VLSEFEMRVLFQMSANDSAVLVDLPNASNLGMDRAHYYNEIKGYLETFRPCAPPSNAWLDEAGEKLQSQAVEPLFLSRNRSFEDCW
jgi:S-DNA-T family DNA segregation ATPase FtsK/SpoIIIE